MLKLVKNDIVKFFKNKSNIIYMVLGVIALGMILNNEIYQKVGLVYINSVFISVWIFDDEEGRDSEKIFLSLPITRRDYVLSKYLVVPIIFMIVSTIANIFGLFLNLMDIKNYFVTSMGEKTMSFLLASMVISISLPWFFLLSSKIARGISIFIIVFTQNYFLPLGRGGGLDLNGAYLKYGGLGLISLSLVALAISAYISMLIYRDRDF